MTLDLGRAQTRECRRMKTCGTPMHTTCLRLLLREVEDLRNMTLCSNSTLTHDALPTSLPKRQDCCLFEDRLLLAYSGIMGT